MHDQFANAFYGSEAWKKCRAAYQASVGGLCERCLARGLYTPAEQVHHKVPLTPETVKRPEIALGWDNLVALCRDCHAAEHLPKSRRWRVDKLGQMVIVRE